MNELPSKLGTEYIISTHRVLISNCVLFQKMEPKFVLLLLNALAPCYYIPQDEIIEDSDGPHHMWFIVKGMVRSVEYLSVSYAMRGCQHSDSGTALPPTQEVMRVDQHFFFASKRTAHLFPPTDLPTEHAPKSVMALSYCDMLRLNQLPCESLLFGAPQHRAAKVPGSTDNVLHKVKKDVSDLAGNVGATMRAEKLSRRGNGGLQKLMAAVRERSARHRKSRRQPGHPNSAGALADKPAVSAGAV